MTKSPEAQTLHNCVTRAQQVLREAEDYLVSGNDLAAISTIEHSMAERMTEVDWAAAILRRVQP